MSAETQTKLPAFTPKAWQERFSDLVVEPEEHVYRDRFFGISKETGEREELHPRHLDKSIEEAWGYTPEMYQQFLEDPDAWDATQREVIQRAHGTYIESKPAEKESPTDVESRLADLEKKFATLEQELSEVKTERDQLQEQNEMLKTLLKKHGIKIPNDSDASKTNKKKPVRVVGAGSGIGKKPAPSPEEISPSSEAKSERGNWWDRLKARYTNSKSRAVTTVLVRKNYKYDEEGRVVVEEEEREEEKDRKWPYAVAGAVGGLALGALLWYRDGDSSGLEGFQEWVDDRESFLDIDIDGDGDINGELIDEDPEGDGTDFQDSDGDNLPDFLDLDDDNNGILDWFENEDRGDFVGTDAAGDHIDTFALPGGNGRSTVELPRDMSVGGSEGHWYIFDTKTDTRVVEMGVNVTDIQDQQGNLSTEARSILEDKGYDLTQKKKHYMDGSGIRRWHYFTDVSR